MDSYKLIAFIKRGQNRKKIFLAIDKAIMPSEIVKKVYNKSSSTYFTIVSRSLKELTDFKLIKIINPKEKTGRHYELTPLGRKIKVNLTGKI